jgi:hypothetical protein
MSTDCSNLNLNKELLAGTVGAAVLIIMGVVEVDHLLDKKDMSTSKLGVSLFTLGWIFMAVLVSVQQDTGKFDWNLLLKRGLPALVVFAAAMISQNMMKKGGKGMMMGGMTLFVASWGLFSSMLIYTNKTQRKHREVLIYGGAALINVSMVALFLNREYNAMSGKWDGPGNVYGMGLPMFTLGWIAVCVGISLC